MAQHWVDDFAQIHRSIRARLGAPEAITATARKLALIVYHLLTRGQPSDETVFLEED